MKKIRGLFVFILTALSTGLFSYPGFSQGLNLDGRFQISDLSYELVGAPLQVTSTVTKFSATGSPYPEVLLGSVSLDSVGTITQMRALDEPEFVNEKIGYTEGSFLYLVKPKFSSGKLTVVDYFSDEQGSVLVFKKKYDYLLDRIFTLRAYRGDGSLSAQVRYQYDLLNGKLVDDGHGTRKYDSKGGYSVTTGDVREPDHRVSEYDSKDRLIRYKVSSSEGKVSVTEYTYGTHGYLTEILSKTNDVFGNSNNSKKLVAYEFDSSGNWIRKTTSLVKEVFGEETLVPLELVTRKVAYTEAEIASQVNSAPSENIVSRVFVYKRPDDPKRGVYFVRQSGDGVFVMPSDTEMRYVELTKPGRYGVYTLQYDGSPMDIRDAKSGLPIVIDTSTPGNWLLYYGTSGTVLFMGPAEGEASAGVYVVNSADRFPLQEIKFVTGSANSTTSAPLFPKQSGKLSLPVGDYKIQWDINPKTPVSDKEEPAPRISMSLKPTPTSKSVEGNNVVRDAYGEPQIVKLGQKDPVFLLFTDASDGFSINTGGTMMVPTLVPSKEKPDSQKLSLISRSFKANSLDPSPIGTFVKMEIKVPTEK